MTAEYDLSMPFVCVTSRGGPFDDDAFAAGWQAGIVDRSLGAAKAIGVTRISFVVDARIAAQLELVGMGYGFLTMESVEFADHPTWRRVTFLSPEDAAWQA